MKRVVDAFMKIFVSIAILSYLGKNITNGNILHFVAILSLIWIIIPLYEFCEEIINEKNEKKKT